MATLLIIFAVVLCITLVRWATDVTYKYVRALIDIVIISLIAVAIALVVKLL